MPKINYAVLLSVTAFMLIVTINRAQTLSPVDGPDIQYHGVLKKQGPAGTTYYLDATGGNDADGGTSPATAWKTLAKVNGTTFLAGDNLLFKAGEVWTGRLNPKGSGNSGNPIIIDMYGTGSKPLIDGNGMTGTGVVYLYNQQYWEINNLEITNNAASGDDRRGVRIEAKNFGTASHIYLKNLNVHNIKGLVGQGRPEKRTGGIGFAIVSVSSQDTHFNDILVENCLVTSCDNQGIITECVTGDGFAPYSAEWNSMKITNAVIRNNTISDISKNAMIIRLFEGGVVEHNLCFNTANGISGNTIFSAACSGTVFQYNEGYANHSPDADGSLYDADLRSPNTYWQYSYSHENAHGLFWTCTDQADDHVVCRYNISQNDQGIIFCINYPVTSVSVYNNTVYCDADLSPIIISERNNGGSGTRTYTFSNNLICNMSATASYDFTPDYIRTIDYNCFWGLHPANEPADPHKITSDPKLVNPGSGGNGLTTVTGYQLQANSSCINAGTVITDNGGKDFWGNPLYNGVPDIGAHEYALSPTGIGGDQEFHSDQDRSLFKVYPCPTSGLLTIELRDMAGTSGVHAEGHRVNGDMAFSVDFCSGLKHKLSLTNFPDGIYLIHLSAGEKAETIRIIKQQWAKYYFQGY